MPPLTQLTLLVATLLTTATATIQHKPPRPAMTLKQYQTAADISSTPSPSPNPPSHPSRPPILFIPGFQGTLLEHCTPNSICRPLFLAPLTSTTWRTTYARLLNETPGTTKPLRPRTDSLLSVDYPAARCAPSPYTHLAHCAPLPARGPVFRATRALASRGYATGVDLHFAGYDWRARAHVATSGAWGTEVSRRLVALNGRAVLLAHGSGCRLAADLLARADAQVRALVCVAAREQRSRAARQALRDGGGALLAWGAHAAWTGMSGSRGPRLDFRAVEFELGLRRRRRASLPEVPGPWDVVDDGLAAPVAERVRLADGFEGLREMAEGRGVRAGGVRVFCVVGAEREEELEGKGKMKEEEGCREWVEEDAEVVKVENADLSKLIMAGLDAVERAEQCEGELKCTSAG